MRSLDSRELSWYTLAAELRNHGTKMVDSHKMTITVMTTMDDGQDQPGSLLWVNLIKIHKEALTNIIKHSQAKSIAIILKVAGLQLQLTIKDDGIGCKSNRSTPGGRGLSNMKRRAERLGGKMI